MKYVKKETGKVVEAEQFRSTWFLKHSDGGTSTLSDAKFQKRYILESEFGKLNAGSSEIKQ